MVHLQSIANQVRNTRFLQGEMHNKTIIDYVTHFLFGGLRSITEMATTGIKEGFFPKIKFRWPRFPAALYKIKDYDETRKERE